MDHFIFRYSVKFFFLVFFFSFTGVTNETDDEHFSFFQKYALVSAAGVEGANFLCVCGDLQLEF